MKKTAQTLLTAAIFATALGSSAQSQMQQPVQAAGDPIIELQTNMAGVYGPPPAQNTTLTTTSQTVYNIPAYPEHELPSTTTEDIIPQPAYGPPRTAFPGDTNWDARADARDLTVIKRAAQFGAETVGYFEYDAADVNSDGIVDKEDVRIFMEETLGIPKKEEAVTTAPAVTTTALLTTLITSTEEILPQPEYGPPPVTSALTQTTVTTTDTELIPVPLYGPPSMMQ